MDSLSLWDQIDTIKAEMHKKFMGECFAPDDVVVFAKPYNKIPAKTPAVIVDRHGEYYAVMVNSNYIEGIHKAFLKGKEQ